MTNFECCKGKSFPSSYYICTDCFKIYHKSCVLKNKSKYTFSTGFKIKCCETTETYSSQSLLLEKNFLEETIQELTESSQVHENYWRKIKADYDKFLEEATEREQELNDLLRKQSDQIIKYSAEIKKLQDLISELTHKTCNTLGTQTNNNDHTKNSKRGKEMGTQTDIYQDLDDLISKPKHSQNNRNINQSSGTVESSKDQLRNILLVAGYHGKNLVSFIISHMGKCTVTSIIKPHASNKELIDSAISNSKYFSKNDVVLMWPNNVNRTHFQDLNLRLKHTNFIILSSPYRYDNQERNDKIFHDNLTLNKMVHLATGNLKQVINVNAILRKSNYCPGGYHINNIGKKYIAKHIVHKIMDMKLCKKTCNRISGDIGDQNMAKSTTVEQHQKISCYLDINNQVLTEGNVNFLYPRLTQIELL